MFSSSSSLSLAELAYKNPPNSSSMSYSQEKITQVRGVSKLDPAIPITPTPPILSSAPRVSVIDGKLVVDEDSLVLDRPLNVDSHRERVEETSKWTTSASFKKATPRNRWSTEDTMNFYHALKLFGTDFEMIAAHLKTRTRAQVKNKFKKEERENPVLVAATLSCNFLPDKMHL